MECPDFLISYSEDGLIKIKDLIKFFSEYGELTLERFRIRGFGATIANLARS